MEEDSEEAVNLGRSLEQENNEEHKSSSIQNEDDLKPQTSDSFGARLLLQVLTWLAVLVYFAYTVVSFLYGKISEDKDAQNKAITLPSQDHNALEKIRETKNQSRNEKCKPNLFPIYTKRAGTKDLGREFEQVMCGYYALKLAINDEVEDFEMTSNNKDDGKFDDIGIKVIFTSGNCRRFLFQLKHKGNRNINLADLQSESTNNYFKFKEYIKYISETEVKEDTVYIYATNSSTNVRGDVPRKDEFNVQQCNELEFKELLVNTKTGKEDVIFEINSKKLNKFFYLFTSQMNLNETEHEVNEMLKNLLHCEIHGAFASYFKNWWLGKFILTKHDVIAKISELAFPSFLKTVTFTKCNEKTRSLNQAFMEFPLTIIEKCEEGLTEGIWTDEKSWTEADFGKANQKYGLKEHQVLTTLWYLGEIPLIVKVDRSNGEIIKRVMNFLLKNMGNKRIILSGKVTKNDFTQCDTFENLSDVIRKCQGKKYYSDIMQKCKVSLQGRGSITLEDLINIDSNVAQLIGTKELLKMSQQEHLLIGKQPEELPNSHIPRTVSPILVKTEDILNVYQSLEDTLIIVNCDESFASKLSRRRNIYTVELSQYMTTTTHENMIILSTRSKCTNLQFDEICEKSLKSNVYLVQHIDQTYCILMLRKGSKLRFEFTDTKKAVKESQIFQYYNNPLHVFCAPPGMGKSTLVQVLYNTCPPDCLAVHVSLINDNAFLARKPDFEAMLAGFLQIDGQDTLFEQLVERFVKKYKLYMFLDGLDEVNSLHVDSILKFVKRLSSNGANIWISSRENLRETICKTLNVVPVDIKELDKEEQKRYIHHKLKESYTDEEIEKITKRVFRSTHLNNSQNLLGIPLQLHIITEMFLNNREIYEDLEQQNFFVLTKMYKIFFEGKMKFARNKLVDKDSEQQLGYHKSVLQDYELPALKACLDKEDYQILDVLNANKETDFLHNLKTEGDKYGIIKHINENDEAVFDHQTYAEYLACVWLKKNWNSKCRRLLLEKIFTEKYENLRLVFDVMLAENNPLHLAVIYKDVKQVEKHIEEIKYHDAGGRTAFHLAFSYGQTQLPVLDDEGNHSYRLEGHKRETSQYMRMIERLLQDANIPEEQDHLFHLDCVRYALRCGCLYPIEKMLEKRLLDFGKLEIRDEDKKAWAYFSAQYGYPHLLSELIKDNSSLINRRIGGKSLLKLAVRGCDGDVCTPPREGNIQAAKLLIANGATSTQLILWVACQYKRFDMLEILIENEATSISSNGNTILHFLVTGCAKTYYNELVTAIETFNLNVDARNDNDETPLHVAAESADLTIVQALTEIGANLHILGLKKRNALHYAASNSRQDVIKFFLDKGLSVDAQDKDGVTPLHLACLKGSTKNVKLLLKQGARVNLTDYGKNNALHHALKSNWNTQDKIRLLIRKGVDVNARNTDGLVPKEHPKIANLSPEERTSQ